MSARYKPQSSSKKGTVQCFNCGEDGHISRFCKNPRREDRSEESEERESNEKQRMIVRKGAPGPQAREEQASMAYAPAAYPRAGHNMAYGVRGHSPDEKMDSDRLSCDGKEATVAFEDQPRANRWGMWNCAF